MSSEDDPDATIRADDETCESLPEAKAAKTSARSSSTTGAVSGLRGAPSSETAPLTLSPPEEAKPGRELAKRYLLVELLGKGTYGEVWAADDTVLRERVALKWMRSTRGSSLPRIRREVTVLRMLRIPGVVRLADEGIEDGRPFLVMELIDGSPFPGDVARSPGSPPRSSWAALAGVTLALLEVLSRVHAAGVVHRDLKPDNILVDAAGRPTVLDFGIALWQDPDLRGGAEGASIAGTPRYLAPEQLLRLPVDARADLYAVGVMLYEALTGQPPHEAPDTTSLLHARLHQKPRPVRELVPSVPAAVGDVVDKLLSTRAEGRLRSALEALAALRGDANAAAQDLGRATPGAIVRALLSAPKAATSEDIDALGPLDEAALRSLFAGPDRLFHLREDAAQLLWERTEGRPSRLEDELTVWTRLGLARWDGSALVTDRKALSQLREGLPNATTAASKRHLAIAASLKVGEEGRLLHLLAADRTREAAQEAVELSGRLAGKGDLEGATAALSEALRAVRQRGRSRGGWAREAERQILAAWAKVALTERTQSALDHALYELERARHRTPELDHLETLLRGSLKGPGADALLVLESLNALPPFEDPELERRRHWARVAAAAARASPKLLKEVLEEVDAWSARSGDRSALLCAIEGRARLRYAEGRFGEAAALHAKMMKLEPSLIGRIGATLNAASALLEAFRHREAAKRAAKARELSARCRQAYREGRAEWLIRAAMYRMGEAGTPDLELVDATARLSAPDLESLVCFNEAAVAFREGSLAVAAELAGRAERIWRSQNRPGGPLLARSLALACGAPAEEGEVEALSREAAACGIAGLGIQALGLLGRAFQEARPLWQEALPRLAAMIQRRHWGQRMDVLSVEEALERARWNGQ